MNHNENLSLDSNTQRALADYRALGLRANILWLLRREYELTESETEELCHLAHLICGRMWQRPDGAPYDLTDSMRDYWNARDRDH